MHAMTPLFIYNDEGKYVAEDDFWKITNHFVEMSRRGKAYAKAGIKEGDEVIDFMGNNTKS